MSSPNTLDEPASVRGTALLTKALDILEFVGEGGRRLKFKDIAEHTGHTRSTLYRILSALMSRGMLDLDKRDQSYVLGPKFTMMAGSINQNSDLIARASAPLRELAEIHGENINLAVLNGFVAVTVARWQGAAAHPFSSALGESKPLHATSVGKVFLAFSEPAIKDMLLKMVDYHVFTDKTLTTPASLEADLRITQARGFALDDNEILDGVVCVAAPIFGPDGKVVAAASFNCPAHRMGANRRAELASVIQAAANRISSELAVRQAEPGPDKRVSRNVTVMDVKAFQVRGMHWSRNDAVLYWIDAAGGSLNHQLDGRREVIELFTGPVQAMCVNSDDDALAVNAGRLWKISLTGRGDAVELLTNPVLEAAEHIHSLSDGALLMIGAEGMVVLAADGTIRSKHALDHVPVFSAVSAAEKIVMTSGQGTELKIVQLTSSGAIATTDQLTLERPAPGVAALHLGEDGTISLSQHDGWSVWQYDRHGKVKNSTPLPVPTATSLAGGESRSIIYAGSDRLSLTSNQLQLSPLAGGIFRIDTSA
jgi:IclR family acetate operon transcriptional repressor